MVFEVKLLLKERMISAKEAKVASTKCIGDIVQRELKLINDLITEAVNIGQFKIKINGYSHDTMKALREQYGYETILSGNEWTILWS